MPGKSQYRLFHMQITVIGIYRPDRRKTISKLHFSSGIFDLSGIDIHLPAIDRHSHNQIFPIDIKNIYPIKKPPIHRTLRPGQLIIPQSLRSQIGIGRPKHIKLPDRRIAETFPGHQFYLCIRRQVERQSSLRNPFGPHMRMMIDTYSQIQCQPTVKMLAKIYISGHFVLLLIDLRLAFTTIHRLIPGLPAEMKEIDSCCETVSFKELYTLIPRQSQHIVP